MIVHALSPLLMWLKERERERERQSVCQHSVSNCLHQIALAFTQMESRESGWEIRRERERGDIKGGEEGLLDGGRWSR